MYYINKFALLEFGKWMRTQYALSLTQKTDGVLHDCAIFFKSMLYAESEVILYVDLSNAEITIDIVGKIIQDFTTTRKIAIIQQFITKCLI